MAKSQLVKDVIVFLLKNGAESLIFVSVIGFILVYTGGNTLAGLGLLLTYQSALVLLLIGIALFIVKEKVK